MIYSDLHLEFEHFEPITGNGKYLFLAGDICVAQYFNANSAKAEDFRIFFNKCSEMYQEVFYVIGNHEHYHGVFDNTVPILRANLPDNVTILDNELIERDGVRILGGTMWTKFTNPIAENVVKNGLNDFRLIRDSDDILQTSRTQIEFEKFKQLLIESKPDIVMTHHAPSPKSIAPRFINDHYMNEGFYVNMEEHMGGVKVWIHGHMHNTNDYMIGDTRIICNPRGYGYETHDFYPKKDFSLDEI